MALCPALPLVLAVWLQVGGPGPWARGTVLGPDGRGLPGAEVLLATAGARDGPVFRAKTAEDGRFHLPPLDPGAYDLTVRTEGLATVAVRGIPVVAPPFELGTVRMAAGASVVGRVVDPTGAPVAGASVTAEPPEAVAGARWGAGHGPPEALEEAWSAPDGSFRLEGLPPDLPARLRAQAEGYLPSGPVPVRLPAEDGVDIVLEPGVRMRGRVVDTAGRGVSEAAVTLDPAAPDSARRVRAETGEDGTFSLVARPGRATVAARAAGYAPAQVRGIELSRAAPAEELELVLAPGAVLTGRVTDAGGRPLPGARVGPELDGDDLSGRPPAVSGTDGVYRLEGLAPGDLAILAWAEGHAPERREAFLEPGENHLDLALESRDGVVEGRVVGPAGGIAADLRLERASDGFAVGRTTSTEDGTFAFASVPAGEYRVTARAPGHAAGTSRPFRLAESGERAVDVRLEAAAEVTGRIRGVEPAALAAVVVEARGGGSLPLPGTIRYDGAYRVEGLAPGRWTIHAELPGAGRTAAAPVEVLPGEAQVNLDLDFEAGLTLRGEVLVDGRAVRGVRVEAAGVLGATATSTDAYGRFLLRGLPEGKTLLSVRVPETGLYREWRLDLARDEAVRLEL